MIRRDPIVEEVRKHRAAIAREHGNDIEAILAALEREPDDTPTVSLPPKRLATRVSHAKHGRHGGPTSEWSRRRGADAGAPRLIRGR